MEDLNQQPIKENNSMKFFWKIALSVAITIIVISSIFFYVYQKTISVSDQLASDFKEQNNVLLAEKDSLLQSIATKEMETKEISEKLSETSLAVHLPIRFKYPELWSLSYYYNVTDDVVSPFELVFSDSNGRAYLKVESPVPSVGLEPWILTEKDDLPEGVDYYEYDENLNIGEMAGVEKDRALIYRYKYAEDRTCVPANDDDKIGWFFMSFSTSAEDPGFYISLFNEIVKSCHVE